MKHRFSIILGAAILILAASCTSNQGFKTTASGLLYKVVGNGSGNVIKKGQFMKFHYFVKLGDSTLFSTLESVPMYVRIDSTPANYNIPEVLQLLRKGDSVVIVQLADSIQAKTGQPLPSNIKKKDRITYTVKVLDIFNDQAQAVADKQVTMDEEKTRESKTIEDYLAANNIHAQKTKLGTYVVVNAVGDGPAVDSGKVVSVMYTGKFFPGGKVFETNTTGPNSNPLKFMVGNTGGIIQGWDDGLRLFKKGGKGVLYIPAYLAYGQTNQGPSHKPFENLIFEVEVIGVDDAPPAQGPATKLPPIAIPQQKPATGK